MNRKCEQLLAEALRTYGDHTRTCNAWLWTLTTGTKPLWGGCNCGYAVLSGQPAMN